jgi:tetratricopeptide (TPR) repeat protein
MKSRHLLVVFILAIGLAVGGLVIYRIPGVRAELHWQIVSARTYIRNVFDPAGKMPTPLPQPRVVHIPLPSPTPRPTMTPCAGCSVPTATPIPEPTITPTPIPLPPSAAVPSPQFEKQDQNNCGPATLAMYLRWYGWQNDQYEIAKLIKPLIDDRNVNVDELIYYVRTRAGWLNADYRVGGSLELLKRFLANGLPVMIEEESLLDVSYWPNDDRWAGHYLLLTAYDDVKQVFISQDSWIGANLEVPYQELDRRWQTFNRVLIYIYRPEMTEVVKGILGADWDEDTNRMNAMIQAQDETHQELKNPFAWFNLGTNLLYFERYGEAARAFDTARQVGLPQRMLRYQFGPFIAYFKSGRNDDLLALAEYALKITPNSEENLLWYGWALYRKGNQQAALEQFEKALKYNQTYLDAQYAVKFVKDN